MAQFARAIILTLLGTACLTTPVRATQVVGSPEIVRQGSHATVRWQTDVACGTRARVTPSAKVVETEDLAPTTSHAVTVDDLKPGIAYQITFGTARKWLVTQNLTPNTPLPAAAGSPVTAVAPPLKRSMSARPTWGNPSSLPDHFQRHGADFGAKDPQDYARKAAEFLERAKREGLPAKLDRDGVLRVFDPASGAFAAYNHDGTTKTFFKPGSRDNFARQPGNKIDLRTWK